MVKFDRFIFVDWSGGVSTKQGANSIWVASCKSSCEGKIEFENLTKEFLKKKKNKTLKDDLEDIFFEEPFVVNTVKRSDTLLFLKNMLKRRSDDKTLMGFDFGFGYPHKAYEKYALDKTWKNLWCSLNEVFLDEDGSEKKRDRFNLAKEWNEEYCLCFWGEPSTKKEKYPRKLEKNKVSEIMKKLGEFRITEERVRWSGVKSQWQLYGAGSVGSQTLLGIPYVEKLRQCLGQKAVKVWPFETEFDKKLDDDFDVLMCEVHFGAIVRVGEMVNKRKEEIRDKVQVEEMCRFFAEDNKGLLEKFLKVDCDCVSPCQKKIAQEKEGWILGVPLCLQPCDRPHKK